MRHARSQATCAFHRCYVPTRPMSKTMPHSFRTSAKVRELAKDSSRIQNNKPMLSCAEMHGGQRDAERLYSTKWLLVLQSKRVLGDLAKE